VLGAAATPAGAHGAAPSHGTRTAATILRRTLGATGNYNVVVSLRSRGRAETVTVTVTGAHPRSVRAIHRTATKLTYKVSLTASKRLVVDAVSHGPAVIVKVSATPVPAATTTTAPAQTPSATTSATPTPTPAPAPAPAPAPTPAPAPLAAPPGPGSPYTNLVWSDDFVGNWTSEGGSGAATEPVPSTWNLDDWGGCGDPADSTYPATSNSAYVTSQGLALPATANGSGGYTTPQLDTGGIAGESWQYGTIEASIQLPTGQGLCPAFWMLADNSTGEIDVLEAPSFVNSAFGPLAPYTVFDLHSNNTQVYESYPTPTNWNPGRPNIYGLIWTPTSITWTVNYVPYATVAASSLSPAVWSVFTSGKFHLLLDEAVGGWPGAPAAGTVFTQPMLVQWVKVFQ